jgi:signal transduction histidine kinase/response regulator of citrate/malate metabolism
MNYMKINILIVEDNLQDFIIFKEVLGQIRDFFIQLDHAENLHDAVEKATGFEYDLIFLDLFLPDSFGQETFNQFNSKIHSSPVVVLSGHSDKSLALDIVKEGAQDYLVKGEFDSKLLEKSIIYSIERKKYQDILERSEKKYRSTFQSVGIAICENDYSQLYEYLKELKNEGVTDILGHLKIDYKKAKELRKMISLKDLNPESLRLYGYGSLEEASAGSLDYDEDDLVNYTKGTVLSIWESRKCFEVKTRFKSRQGEIIHTLKKLTFLGDGHGYCRMLVSTADITVLAEKEAEVRTQSLVLQKLAESAAALLAGKNMTVSIKRALGIVGKSLNASSMDLLLIKRNENGTVELVHNAHWDHSSAKGQKHESTILRESELQPLFKVLEKDEVYELISENSDNLALNSILSNTSLHALIAPVKIDGVLEGMAVLNGDGQRELTDFERNGLLTLSRNLGSAVATQRAQKGLFDMNATLEQRVIDRTSKWEEANQQLESFSYSVSHDLRAPLRAISGFTEVLAEECEGQLDDQGKHYLGIIREGAARMSQLIDDLLDFSRMGRKNLVFKEVDMQELTAEVVFELERYISEDRKVIFDIAELPVCKGDGAMLRQVLINFISNAIKFTSKKEEAHIAVFAKEEVDMIEYVVKDNGVGFNMEYADKLFRVFQRLHPTDDFEGTGVGLAIVQRIVVRHGGKVTAEATVGEGAEFHFSLPKPGVEIEVVQQAMLSV